MSTNLFPPIHVTGVRTPSVNHLRRNSTSNGGGANWWSPLFGWSSDVDYIDSNNKKEDPNLSYSDPDPDRKERAARTKFMPGSFTAEKAKQLRMMTSDTASFHDVMYHSAIASRLASDFSQRSAQ